MQPRQFILAGGAIILATGFGYAVINNKPKTPVLAGGFGVILLASLLEAFGPGPGKLGAGLVGIATLAILLNEGPSIFQAVNNLAKKGK